MSSLAEFIEQNQITMTAKRTDRNPKMDGGQDMDHWRCYLKSPYGRMVVTFSMGSGHNGKAPTAADVLDCLASDASGVENANSFEDWASDYGYDTDSRKAFETYETCQKQATRLNRLVGDQYEALLWETERL